MDYNSLPKYSLLFFSALNIFFSCNAFAGTTQERIEKDIANNEPVVVHVSVALADNNSQWIVSVPETIGNGQDPNNNLYWGARYGLRTFFVKDAGWKIIKKVAVRDSRILERLILFKSINRNGIQAKIYLIADAWDGRYISDTIKQFLAFSAGRNVISLSINDEFSLDAGGASHLNVYIGHDALMDFFGLNNKIIQNPERAINKPESDAIVLACRSKDYFESRLNDIGAHPLVLTSGLMAPEAYSLDAAITAWVMGLEDNEVRKHAAAAYAKYQKINSGPANHLFSVLP